MTSSATPILHAVLDSGIPDGSTDFTTIVILHGFMWRGETFEGLLTLAAQRNARLISLNRRDYPGSKPYSANEHVHLREIASAPTITSETRNKARDFMRHRAQEVYDYLANLVKTEHIPPTQDEGSEQKGGIVLVGWSFASTLMMAFAAHAPALSRSSDIQLSNYVRRIVPLDGSLAFLGLQAPPETSNELPDIAESEEATAARIRGMHEWAAKYYAWDEERDVNGAPKITGCTLDNLSSEEQANLIFNAPGLPPDGSDHLTMNACFANDVYRWQKNAAFHFTLSEENGVESVEPANGWDKVEIRIVWCDQAMWGDLSLMTRLVEDEMAAGKRAGRTTRKVSTVRLHGNHFAPLDSPKETFVAVLENVVEI